MGGVFVVSVGVFARDRDGDRGYIRQIARPAGPSFHGSLDERSKLSINLPDVERTGSFLRRGLPSPPADDSSEFTRAYQARSYDVFFAAEDHGVWVRGGRLGRGGGGVCAGKFV